MGSVAPSPRRPLQSIALSNTDLGEPAIGVPQKKTPRQQLTPKQSLRKQVAPPECETPVGGLEDDMDLDIVLTTATPPRAPTFPRRSPTSALAAMRAYRQMQNAEDRLVEIAGIGGLRHHRKDDVQQDRHADQAYGCWGPADDDDACTAEPSVTCIALDGCTVS